MRPERIDHDALDVRLHCGYINTMPLSSIQRLWEIGTDRKPIESNVARVIRDVGGWLVYRDGYWGRGPMITRVHYYKDNVGSYPWRVSLHESGANETWREVNQVPTFAEAEAAARRYVRQDASASPRGDGWVAVPLFRPERQDLT